MFNLGMGEITVILLLALIFLGPKKLPELASGLGRIIKDIRKATADVKNQIQLDEMIRKPFEELRDAVTLPPEELKRRDRLQKELEDAKRKAEQEIRALAAKVSQDKVDLDKALLDKANLDQMSQELSAKKSAPAEASPFADQDAAAAAALAALATASAPVPGAPLLEPQPGGRPRVATPPPTPRAAMPAVSFAPAGTVPTAASKERATVRGLAGPIRAARGPLAPGAPVPPTVQAIDKPIITQFLSEADLMPPGNTPPPAPPPIPGAAKLPGATPPPPGRTVDDKKS